MSKQVIDARARVKAAREKHAVAKRTFTQTQALKTEIIESFLALGIPLESAELFYQRCLEAADLATAIAVDELNEAVDELELIDPRPTEFVL